MFGLFKKKSALEKLQEEYQKALAESHRLSTVDRKASDLKLAEAEQIMDRIMLLKQQSQQN